METDGGAGNVVRNKKLMLKDYIKGSPKESDLHLTTESIELKVPQGSNAVLVKVLYLSIDPYQYIRSTKIEKPGYFSSYSPGSVSYCSATKIHAWLASVNSSFPFDILSRYDIVLENLQNVTSLFLLPFKTEMAKSQEGELIGDDTWMLEIMQMQPTGSVYEIQNTVLR
ncbi:hypothetical protein POTOM_054427 [Populus tomentosa]|uniref:Oxidoreductase N-terminal domain-containing protein n=1 Tax=Populus tomentosa TaxID=118781 RepID=A0A8X7Y0F5_POPTO|nr:hypothetical protein POTOM_054427 [Populus tomentosa]